MSDISTWSKKAVLHIMHNIKIIGWTKPEKYICKEQNNYTVYTTKVISNFNVTE